MPTPFGPLSLGELIDQLDKFRFEDLLIRDEESRAFPVAFRSYRGFYEHVAIHCKENTPIKVSQFRDMARLALGVTYSGYKGGSYTATRDTPVWVSQWGETSGRGVVAVHLEEDADGPTGVRILTEDFS